MNIHLVATPVFSQSLPAIVLFSFQNERPTLPPALRSLFRHLRPKEFEGSEKQLLLHHTPGKSGLRSPRLLLAGLGKRESFSTEVLRRTAGSALRRLREAGLDRAAIAFDLAGDDALHALVEAAELVNYRFSDFKADNNHTELKSLTICLPAKTDLRSARQVVHRAQAIAQSANFARSLGNLPGNVVYPAVLAERARQLAKEFELKCTVLDKAALEKGGFGGLLAVGAGSAREPHLIVLEYNPEPGTANQKPIALVGKAITFDTGGISIKPSDKMDEMKFDKCGGCAVLGTMRAIAALKLPVSVLGIIAAAENMPSATSYRPGDIVTSYRGKDKRGVTIEVLNTDAEGRVVLGDALAYAREREPQAILDYATLTGACVVALGGFAAGLFGNDDKLIEKVRAAGERTGERVWPFPLWQEYKDKIKSDVADHKNTGGREGGAITAAAFLAKYVGEVPWAHLDIAGTGWTNEERPYLAKGATGFGVRLTLDLLSRWA